jgi:O-acetyl-ADP-ribose deacetylase (regulator of RNase III)
MEFHNTTLEVVKGDITQEEVDAIVNAAHEGLCGGGGVDGAIHRAAGPRMTGECMNLYGCPMGEARLTGGYNLPAKYIIHTVGPTWRGGKHGEAGVLASCYDNCMMFAHMQGLRSIAFPCISVGAFCYPYEFAADIAIDAVTSFLSIANSRTPKSSISLVRFVCFEQHNFDYYQKKLQELV